MHPRIRNAIFCDFVRHEDTGKNILIGVYTGDVVLESVPALIPCTFWLDVVTPIQNTDLSFDLRIEWPGPPGKIETNGSSKVGAHKSLALTIPTQLAIDKEGQIRFSIRFAGGRWTEAIVKD